MRSLSRKGLTLVELIVVLLVLTATAAIVVPRFGGVLGAAHGSTGASNIGETAKAIQLYEATRLAAPNNLCSLNDTPLTDTFNFVELSNGATDHFAAFDLAANADVVTALQAAGMTTLSTLDPAAAAENATFGSEVAGGIDLSALGANAFVVVLTDAGEAALGLPNGGAAAEYIVLGVGEQSSLIGTTMIEAPLHFPEAGGEDLPQTTYQRLLAVYRIGDGTNFAEKATLVTVCTNDEGNVAGIGRHLEEYYEAQAQ